MTTLLHASAIRAGYGKLTVLDGVDLDVERGTVVAVIGHNGAGKTSLLNALFGLMPWSDGAIDFDGRDISSDDPAKRLRAGISLVPQGVNAFGAMTVLEHFALVGAARPSDHRTALELFPVLAEKLTSSARSLSGGQRQMLALACGVLRHPRLLLVDEPSTGLSPLLVGRVMEALRSMRRDLDMTVVVVEQNVTAVLAVADVVYAMRAGRVIHRDTAESTRALPPDRLWELL